MKRKTVAISAVAALALGVAAFAAAPTFAHGYGGYGNHGIMSHGYKNCGRLGHRELDTPLKVEDVRKFAEKKLSRHGNDRLKVGKVEATDENTIVAEIVTVDDSLVWKFEIDTRTGAHQLVN